MPNTPSAQYLTPAEVEKRTSSFNARRTLLKSNPSLFISKTRLSIRQIPIFVTERMLKRLSLHALKAFEDEVKNGSRAGLTADELASGKMADDDDEKAQDAEEEGEKKKKKKKKFTGTKSLNTPIKQTKIVRQPERVDAVTGKGRSKGYGFVEMHTHGDALRLLRWANNNPAVGALFEGWWGDELAMLLKLELGKQKQAAGEGEEEKEGGGRDEARVKRIKDELEGVKSGEGGKKRKAKGTLIVEFSIENVQVVQRRKAALERSLQVGFVFLFVIFGLCTHCSGIYYRHLTLNTHIRSTKSPQQRQWRRRRRKKRKKRSPPQRNESCPKGRVKRRGANNPKR
jgi:nucleolar protein 4